jgi:hypothetical protein
VKIFNSTQTFKMFFVLKFELILIIGSNNVVMEGARKVYRGRRVGQGCYTQSVGLLGRGDQPVSGQQPVHRTTQAYMTPAGFETMISVLERRSQPAR